MPSPLIAARRHNGAMIDGASLLACVLLAVPSTAPAEREGAAAVPPTPSFAASPERLRAFHDLLGSEPHIAGTPGDLRTIERLAAAFTEMGLEVEVQWIYPLLCRPVEASLEIDKRPADDPSGLAPAAAPAQSRRGVIPLPLREENLLEDPAAAHPDLTYGWNAYSGSGDVTAEVVYANYGTRADFERLRALGVDCTGRIVLARYGGNFRGYKARFAQEAGAAGLIIFTDPADSGFVKGPAYPEGGWANATCIQRGSLVTLPYVGDPLTPMTCATEDAPRLALDEVDLPKIPVQPIGYAAGAAILSQMRGSEAPAEWKGGLPMAYRLEGGPELKVRMKVVQERAVMKTANVIARLRGAVEPEQEVIIGCHHDAWGFGAADPLAGTICMLESARLLAERARDGWRPRRTITWGAWAAEEFGILGSVEWIESRRDLLTDGGVAYVNLDMAAMGPNFNASSAPSLRSTLSDVAMIVPSCADPERSIAKCWIAPSVPTTARGASPVQDFQPEFADTFGELGGGSDHVGFYCHVGIASCSVGGGGSAGTSYHSNYDTLTWYRKIVGEDYAPAVMVSNVTAELAIRLGEAQVLPLEPWATLRAMAAHLRAFAAPPFRESLMALNGLDEVESLAARFDALSTKLNTALETARRRCHDDAARTRLNAALLRLDRVWIDPRGMEGRPWYRNLYASTDRHSGYATSTAPAFREALEDANPERLRQAVAAAAAVLTRIEQELSRLAADGG